MRCTKCGAEIPAGHPAGLCPVCALDSLLAQDENLEVESRFFGEYQLLEELGRGGMGVVWRARQASLNRLVALKMIAGGELARVAELRRFRKEAAAAARLQHPNIVRIHEIGEVEGQPYFTMDYVEGIELDAVIREGLTPKRVAQYLLKIAEAVHYAHEQGIVHRDLKPSNILIDRNDEPRVMDFGLAKQIGVDSSLTLTGQLIGSPNYMSPEQAAGRHEEVTRATDIYSLGAILYHLVIGRPPFHSGSIAETLHQVQTANPTPLRWVNRSIPLDLETICFKCLEKDPAQRYASAAELASDLGRFLADKPIRARRVSGSEKVWRICRRNPVPSALTALLLLVVLGSVALILWNARKEAHLERQRRLQSEALQKRADEAAQSARANAYAADMLAVQRALADGRLQRARDLLDLHVPDNSEKDDRGFEWFHYRKLTEGEQTQVLFEETNSVIRSAAVSQAASRVAWITESEIKVLQVNSNTLVRQWPHQFPARSIVAFEFSPNGNTLGILLRSNLFVFEIESGTQVSLPVFGHTVLAITDASEGLAAVGKRISAEGQANVEIWDYVRARKLRELPACSGPALRWKTNSTHLVALDQRGILSQWDATNGVRLHSAAIQNMNTNAVFYWADISRDGTKGVVTSQGDELLFFRADGALQAKAAWHGNPGPGPIISEDGTFCAFSQGFGGITLIDAVTGREMRKLIGHRDFVAALGFLDNNQVIGIGRDQRILRWDLQAKKDTVRTYMPPDSEDGPELADLNISSDGRYLAGLGALWRASDMSFVREAASFKGFSPDGRLYAALRGADLSIWSTDEQSEQPAVVYPLNLSSEDLAGVSLSDDGCFLLTTTYSKSEQSFHLQIYHIKSGTVVATRNNSDFARFLPTNELVVNDDTGCIVWNWKNGIVRGRLNLFYGGLVGAVSPDGALIAGRSTNENEISIIDLGTLTERARLKGHSTPATSVLTFSNDGKTLVSVDQINELRLWSVATGREVGVITVAPTMSIGFSSDDSRLFLAGFGEIRVWDSSGRSNLRSTRPRTLTIPEDSIWRLVAAGK